MTPVEPTQEPLLTIAEVTKLIPQRPSRATLWRWISRGVNGVRLRSVKCGGRRLFPTTAVAEFIAACTAKHDGIPLVRGDTKRKRDIDEANSECERDGF
jgi:predicted DNA-binding transcriptional regulator AlpA